MSHGHPPAALSGRSSFTFPCGATYDGDFKDGKLHGQGKIVWPDGVVYEGMLKNGLKHGRGVHTLADGSVYEGNFRKGLKDGKGVIKYATDGSALNFVWSSGDQYDGEFRCDKRHGLCTYTFFNGQVLKCSWCDDICPAFFHHQAALLTTASNVPPEGQGSQKVARDIKTAGEVCAQLLCSPIVVCASAAQFSFVCTT